MGGGGGILLVPLLDRLTRLDRAAISGTVTIANAGIALAGAVSYGAAVGTVAWPLAAAMVAGGVVGAVLGVRVVRVLPPWALRLALLLVLVASIAKIATGRSMEAGSVLPADWPLATLGLAAGVGLLVGAWSSAMGLGGGMLAVPALVIVFACPMPVAIGTSMAIMVPNTLAGALAHWRAGSIDWRLGMRIALGAVVGTAMGSLVARSLPPEGLRLVYCALLSLIALREARLLWRAARRLRPA